MRTRGEAVFRQQEPFVGVILLCVAIPVFAQLPTATILGNAKDASGASVPGVKVTVRNVDTNLIRTVTTADDGSYRVPELPVGHYQVTAEHAGFKTETRIGHHPGGNRPGGDQFRPRSGIDRPSRWW